MIFQPKIECMRSVRMRENGFHYIPIYNIVNAQNVIIHEFWLQMVKYILILTLVIESSQSLNVSHFRY